MFFRSIVPMLLIVGSLTSQPRLMYVFEPTTVDNWLVLNVTLTIRTVGDTTLLSLPNNYGGPEDFDAVRHLRTSTIGAHIVPTDVRHEVRLVRGRNSRVDVHYRIAEVRTGTVNLGDHYQVVVRPGLIHALGNAILVAPKWDDDKVSAEFLWKNVPEGWQIASSFGLGAGPHTAEFSISYLRHSVFMAGTIRVLHMNVGGNPVAVALNGHWKFRDDDFLRLVGSIMKTERDFFNDHAYPFFLVTALEIGGGGDQGGTGRVNSFALFLSDDRTLDLRLKRLLAHEVFHTWNGDRVEREDPESLVYWFTEGFADYYARLFLVRSGLITQQEYVEDLNVVLKEYFSTDMKSMLNSDLPEKFNSSRDFQRLPYRRGDILAHLLRIRLESTEQSLDGALRNILSSARNAGMVISNANLAKAFVPLLPAGDRPFFSNWIEGTLLIDPKIALLGQCGGVEIRERKKYYLFGERQTIPVYSLLRGTPCAFMTASP